MLSKQSTRMRLASLQSTAGTECNASQFPLFPESSDMLAGVLGLTATPRLTLCTRSPVSHHAEAELLKGTPKEARHRQWHVEHSPKSRSLFDGFGVCDKHDRVRFDFMSDGYIIPPITFAFKCERLSSEGLSVYMHE
jgi:hypothetical protein